MCLVKLGFNLIKSEKTTKILLVNSSHRMAKEISSELNKKLPNSEFTFAPTLTLAKVLLGKNSFNLIISSALMPDGNSKQIEALLAKQENPATLIVVKNEKDLLSFSLPGELKNEAKPYLAEAISDLGADLRNDLNNPLQEIVTMVFVAQSNNQDPEVMNQALLAIGNAATNLSSVVKGLETKILKAVG